MTPSKLRAIVEAAGAKAVIADRGVYELGVDDVTARYLTARQTKVLSGIRRLPGTVFLNHDETPRDWELGEWLSPAANVWEVPARLDSGVLLEGFLEGGNWRLYVAQAPLPPGAAPDAFRGNLADLAEILISCGVSVLVDAWHDNTEWRIVITATSRPGTVAA